jgi:hypothetical protein
MIQSDHATFRAYLIADREGSEHGIRCQHNASKVRLFWFVLLPPTSIAAVWQAHGAEIRQTSSIEGRNPFLDKGAA